MKSATTDKLAAHIAATVASWPSPTPDQVRKVTLMLRAAAANKAVRK